MNPANAEDTELIGIRHASFTWAADQVPRSSPERNNQTRVFSLNIDEEVIFPKGKVTLVVGPTGSGKTSLLLALLGEMHYVPTAVDSYVSLPRAKGVAYAAQESWVQNDTIKVLPALVSNRTPTKH